MDINFVRFVAVSLIAFSSNTYADYINGRIENGSDAEIVFAEVRFKNYETVIQSCRAAREAGYTCDLLVDDVSAESDIDVEDVLEGTKKTLSRSADGRLPPKAIGILAETEKPEDGNNEFPYYGDTRYFLKATDFSDPLDKAVVYLESDRSAAPSPPSLQTPEIVFRDTVMSAGAGTFIGPQDSGTAEDEAFTCFWRKVLKDRSKIVDGFNECLPGKDPLASYDLVAEDNGDSFFPLPTSKLVKFFVLKGITGTSDTTGCQKDAIGKLKFSARLQHDAADAGDIRNIRVRVRELTEKNRLLTNDERLLTSATWTDFQDKDALGRFSVPGSLSYGESVDVPFTVCLASNNKFELWVDVVGANPDS